MTSFPSRPFFPTDPRATSSSRDTTPQPPSRDRLLVRARFDFHAPDPSAISFRAGEVIEVFTRLDSGWWDGVLGTQRGWFPSNFTEAILDEEESDGEEEEGMSVLDDAEWGLGAWNGSGLGYGETGLEELAREMMGEREEEGGLYESELEGIARSRRNGRRRGETERTITSLHPSALPRPQGREPSSEEELKLLDAELEDAWVPSLTPDGQVGLFAPSPCTLWFPSQRMNGCPGRTY